MPIVLRRLGLGGIEGVLGIEWILVTTRGRRTGRPHSVMLDVVGHDPARDVYYVQPAYGRADWVQNVAAHPRVEVEVRGRRFSAEVTDVTGAEGAAVVLRFIREHPRYARLVVWFVGYVNSVDRPDDELRALLARTPVFAIRPVGAELR